MPFYGRIEYRTFPKSDFFSYRRFVDCSKLGKSLAGHDFPTMREDVEKEKKELDPDYYKGIEIRQKKLSKEFMTEDEYDYFYYYNIENPDYPWFNFFDYYSKINQQEMEFSRLDDTELPFDFWSYKQQVFKDEDENKDEGIDIDIDTDIDPDKIEDKAKHREKVIEFFEKKDELKERVKNKFLLNLYDFLEMLCNNRIFLKKFSKEKNIKFYGITKAVLPKDLGFYFCNDFFFAIYMFSVFNNSDTEFNIFFWMFFFFAIFISLYFSFLYFFIFWKLFFVVTV